MSIRTKELNNFLYKYKDLAPQGSEEWLKNRLFRIGGSEFSIILGKNPYSNKKKLIKSHVGLITFQGYAATYWGNLLENILTDYINNIFQCEIKETGSINCNKGTNLGYSPDGLAVIKKKYLDIIFNNDHYNHIKNTSLFINNHNDDDLLILFEFKCPYKRIPDKYIIPEYYLPQPQLGMEIINICEAGIFIEAVYRICSIDNIQYNNIYNTIYHDDKLILTDNPIYYGFIAIIYDNNIMDIDIENLKHNIQTNNILYININNYNIYDLGKITKKWLFNKILKYIIQDKKIYVKYVKHNNNHKLKQNIFNKSKYIKNIYNYNIECNIYNEIETIINNLKINEELIGIIPYKLFQLHMKPVKKKLNLITPDIQNEINEVINIIKECHNKSIIEKENIINNYLPNKRKTK